MIRWFRNSALVGATACLTLGAAPLSSHPHVFIDGGVDFVIGPDQRLDALEVTWLYDAFETLYMLSSLELPLNAEGKLDEDVRRELVRLLSDWPDDFDGSAHVTRDGQPLPLHWPEALDARMVGERLEMTFTRRFETPVALDGGAVEVAFYESTYFFDFTVTQTPKVSASAPPGCRTEIIPFKPDENLAEMQTMLAALGREETPGVTNVGAFFADRIVLSCE